jgi:hypothetical protein
MIEPPKVEENVLSLLVHHPEQYAIIALKIQDVVFSNQENQKIATTALEFISEWKHPPGIHLEQILSSELEGNSRSALLRQQLDRLTEIKDKVIPEYVHAQLDEFIRRQRMMPKLQSAYLLTEEGNLEEADKLIYDVSSIQQSQVSSGLWMKDPKQALSFLERDEHIEFFSSGIEVLDLKGVRPERKTIMFLIAPSGAGKSWFLVQVGKYALLHHKKLLHVTLEISEEKTARRYIQSIFGLTMNQAQNLEVRYFTKDEHDITIVNTHQIQADPILSKVSEIKNKIEQWRSCPEWVIKEFPTSTLSIEELTLFIDSLEKAKNFKPDILLLDYADLMKLDTHDLRIDTGRLYKELRGLAVKKGFALVTASQGNRNSATAKLVGTTNVAEDWSKIGTADIVLTYSQTFEEKRLGLARIFVAKSRDSSDGFITLVSQLYPTGQFCLHSTPMTIDLANQLIPPTT